MMAGHSRQVTRRKFLEGTGKGAAVGVPMFVAAKTLGQDGATGANDRLRIGLIGCGGMGVANLTNAARYDDVVVTAACDVQQNRLQAVVDRYKATCTGYRDYRELLAADVVDGVIIATPPHWHFLMAVAACEAKVDFYLQKPMTLHLAESLALLKAVRKHDRITQIGTQIHAGENYRRVVEYVRCGKLGKISVVRTFNVMNQGPEGVGKATDTTVPKGFDWEMWVGPAPMRPFNPILVANSYNHGSFMDYSGGWLPGMAPHIIDLPIWALELGYPTNTSCAGGRFVIDDDGDAPDVQEVLWQYPDLTMTWMGMLANSYGFDFHGDPVPKRRLGIYFHGVNGTLYSNYTEYHVVPEGKRLADPTPPEPSIPSSPGHEREWLDCLRTRKQPSCNVFYHSKIDVPILLANLSLKLGRSIRFDGKTRQIVGDEEARRAAVPEYRAPWRFPDEYLTEV
ncbi:Gfo/Idh/MocA family protein [Thermostilla marina]